MPSHLAHALAGALIASALGACSTQAETVTRSDLTSAEASAAYRIAAARCERRDTCSAATTSDAFPTRDACIRDELVPSAAGARLEECASPVEDARGAVCVDELRRSACGTTVRAVDACRRERLCPDAPSEGTVLAPQPNSPNRANGGRGGRVPPASRRVASRLGAPE